MKRKIETQAEGFLVPDAKKGKTNDANGKIIYLVAIH